MAKRITYICLVLSLTAIVLSSFNLYLMLRVPHVPQTQVDYVIFQDKDLAKAENKRKGTIDFSSPNASFVINQAIEHGSNVYIQEGNYTLSSDIHIFNKQNAKITSDNASFTCNGHKIILKRDDYTKSQNNLLSGFQITNGTIRIENSFRTTTTKMYFKDCSTAIELVNTETWSEATKIEDCHFINSTQGIVFRSPTGIATGSYANSEIERCYFNLLDNSTGIVVAPKAQFNDGKVEGVTFWIGAYGNFNQTGIFVEGSMYETILFRVEFESFADLPVDQLYCIVL